MNKIHSAQIILLLLALPFVTHAQFAPLPAPGDTPGGGGTTGGIPDEVPCPENNNQPQCPDPLIIVPGLLSSHNAKVIFNDKPSQPEDWDFTPGVAATWQPLIDRLESTGHYQLGANLFISHYDWRKSNSESAKNFLDQDIKSAIEKAGRGGIDKVDIVAHSMGGLVTRAYAQSDNYDNDIDQLLMMGTPNKGSVNGYVAWEGGQFPFNWGSLEKGWMIRIESNLKILRNQKDLLRPESWREFFPSLHQLVPTTSFLTRDGSTVEAGDIVDPNTWLADLNANSDILDERGIDVTTIAGTGKHTLHEIDLSLKNTSEVANDTKFNRWRDGHPVTEPIVPDIDVTSGDGTVLASSVKGIGNVAYTIDDTDHTELPGAAQDIVLEILEEDPFVDFPETTFVDTKLAQAAVGVDILSPILPLIVGPNGKQLGIDENLNVINDFGDNGFIDWDPEDINGPKLITILDPSPGTYTVTLTGTDAGPYTAITSYGDDDEIVSEEFTENTVIDQEDIYTFNIGATDGTGSFVVDLPDIDFRELLQQISDMAYQADRDDLIHGSRRAGITRAVKHALNDFRSYERRLDQGRERAAMSRLRKYWKNIDRLEKAIDNANMKNNPDLEPILSDMREMLDKVRQYSPPI